MGNIGEPALDYLDRARPGTLFVYEMSSYLLQGLTTSPQVAVLTAFFPELSRFVRSVGAHSAVFDGELVALGDDGRPDPARLERRAKPGAESAMRRRARDIPVVFLSARAAYEEGKRKQRP